MEAIFLTTFIFTGFLCFGLLAVVYFNIKACRNKERSDRLNFTTIAYCCMLAVFGYTAYWIVQKDVLRMVAILFLLAHAVLLFLMVFVSSKHASKSENLPSVIRASLVTFVIVHFVLPAFPKVGAQDKTYMLFKLFDNEVAATIGLMTAVFLLFVNIILIIAQFVIFLKVRKD